MSGNGQNGFGGCDRKQEEKLSYENSVMRKKNCIISQT